jgi:hypothetical protein
VEAAVFLECSPVVLAVPVKSCIVCGEVKPATREFFSLHSQGRLRGCCKECESTRHKEYYKENKAAIIQNVSEWIEANKEYRKEYCKTYYEANKEHKNQLAKEWYKTNKERVAQTSKVWREANKERVAQTDKAWQESHKEQVARKNKAWRKAHPATEAQREHKREKDRAWRSANPDKAKVKKNRRRARELSLLDTFTSSDWRIALDYFGGCCATCGRPPGLWHTLAADHWIPINKGGPTMPDNIVPLCHGTGGCNNSKGSRDPVEWLVWKFGPRKGRAIQRRIETFLNSRKPKDEDTD